MKSGNKPGFKKMGATEAIKQVKVSTSEYPNQRKSKMDTEREIYKAKLRGDYMDLTGEKGKASMQDDPSGTVVSRDPHYLDSPNKQMTDFSNVTVNGEDAETVKKRNIKEREERKKKKEQEMTDLINNPDQSINKEKFQHLGDYNPKKKKSPAKQTKDTFADGSKKSARNKFNDKETAIEQRKTDRADNQKSQYWYKVNGKKATRAEYIKYQNKPGGDEPGKQTNDPDVYGRIKSNHGRGPKTK